MSQFRVASYNVLSSGLCSPADLTACKPANLNPLNRLPRVQSKVSVKYRRLANNSALAGGSQARHHLLAGSVALMVRGIARIFCGE